MKSVLPSRTSRIVRPGNDTRNPRTTVSTSGSSGMRESSSKITQSANASCVRRQKKSAAEGFSPGTSSGHELRQGKSRGSHDTGHAQNLLIFFFCNRRNNQPDIFKELQFAHHRIGPQLVKSNLPRQAFH